MVFPQKARQRGFTLIELVVVIVLMSIISLAGIESIRFTAEAYGKMSGRQTLGNSARVAIDRMSREIRQALPTSARVSGDCIEFIPINAAGRYLDLPVEASSNTFKAVPLNPGQSSTTGAVAVYPVVSNVYDSSSKLLSASASVGAPDIDNEVTVTMSRPHQFPYHSPNQRFFLVGSPVSYCIDGDNLFRYKNYGVNVTQPGTADLPGGLPDRALLVNQVGNSVTPFTVVGSSLQRNAMVRIDLSFDADGEAVKIVHEAQLRNVP